VGNPDDQEEEKAEGKHRDQAARCDQAQAAEEGGPPLPQVVDETGEQGAEPPSQAGLGGFGGFLIRRLLLEVVAEHDRGDSQPADRHDDHSVE